MYHGNLAASVAAWLAAGRVALAWNVRHSLYDVSLEKPMTRQVIRANRLLSKRPDAIVYNSKLSLEQHSDFGISRLRSHVIPNGFDLDIYRPDADTRRVQRDALDIPPGTRVVGHVARFHPMKDHASFLHVARGIAAKHPDVRFLLAGREVDTGNPALAGIIPAELEDRFVFLGERRDVQVLMQAMDVLCLSSSWGEAFPNVLGEAMASGVPCVATDVGDSRLIVGDTGVIVPPRDQEALANGLMSILSRPIEQRRALGDAARERIHERYSLSRIVNMYEALYERLVSTCD
jgi:glycosyltransferase involved in cell wall biosynthesis